MPAATSSVAIQTTFLDDEPVGGNAPGVVVGGPDGVDVTVTVNDDEAVRPAPSVAVHVTVVTPSWNDDPDAGAQTTVGATPELSEALGNEKVTTTGVVSVVVRVRSGRSAIVGGSLSIT